MRSRHLVPAALLALAACTLAIPVTIVRELAVSAPAGTNATTLPIDLSRENAVWSRRNNVKDFTIDQVKARILSLGSGNAASRIALQLKFRPDGAPVDGSQDVLVGEVPFLDVANGAEASLPGSPAAEALIMDAIRGTGRFSVVAQSTTDAALDAQVELTVAGSLTYEALRR